MAMQIESYYYFLEDYLFSYASSGKGGRSKEKNIFCFNLDRKFRFLFKSRRIIMTKIKKAISVIYILAMVLLPTSIFAVTTYPVWFSFNTGSGNGYVDGASNGVFYDLEEGTASIQVNDTLSCYSEGTYRLTLYKYSWFGMGTNCGTMVATGTGPNVSHFGIYNIPSDGDYYLYGTGEGAYRTYAAAGSIIQQ
ncbi:MAG: hypothetical protein IKH03_03960 [Oscillospiraceae bacterium]|nr:hypothetical protein [Oscillospiraceae bacterium]